MIVGEKIYLVPLDPANAETSRRWINDPAVNEWLLTGAIPVSAAAEADFYLRAERDAAARSGFVFEVHRRDDDRYIGNCSLIDVDLVHRHAELGIVIGDLDQQNKGYGRDAIRTLLRFGFDTLGLHTIEIRHVGPNERGAHLYRSIGFREAGRLREHLFVRGEWCDDVILDLTAQEWAELR